MVTTFDSQEIQAFTRTEAINQAPYQIIRDVTQSWIKNGRPVTQSSLNAFLAEQLTKHTKGAAGIGCSITLSAGSPDTRECPDSTNIVKNEKGKRKYTRIIEVTDNATGKVLFTHDGSKASAKKAMKEYRVENKDYKGNATGKYCYKCTEGESVAFVSTYTPSISAKLGTYLVFGIKA